MGVKGFELVMSQAGLSRTNATKALKKRKKEFFDAIMGLTMNGLK